MASKTYPGWLVGVLAVAAAGGWGMAWSNNGGGKSTDSASASEDRSAKSSSRSRGGRISSPVGFIADADTARLLTTFEEIHSAAVPGKVNERLMQACRGALLDGNMQRRARNYSLLLQLMRPEDGPALHEQFLELHREGKTYDEYKAMANRWGELDAVGAIEYISSRQPLVFPPDDFRAIVRGWAQQDPEAALKWMDANPDMAGPMNGKTAVLEGWIREDPKVALSWIDSNIAKMKGRDYVEAVRVAFTNQISGGGSGPEDAAEWLVSLPENELLAPASAMAWQNFQWSLAEMPYDKAASVWGKIGGQQWVDFNQFGGFCHDISSNRVADQGVEGFLNALEKTWPADQVSTQFQRWATQNPRMVTAWLSEAPSSGITRAAIEGTVKALQQSDPQAAAEWAAKLER